MDIEYFKYLIEVAEAGSISKASNNLFISQSYLSRIIQEIELMFNTVIFIRNNRGVKLTKEGKKFLSYANSILDTYEKMNSLNPSNKENNISRLKISSVRSSLAMEALILLEKEIKSDKLRLKLIETNNTDVIKDIYYLESHIGVIVINRDERNYAIKQLNKLNLEYKKISNLSNHIIVRENHPLAKKEKVSLEDLKNYGVIKYNSSFLTKNSEIIGTSFNKYIPNYDYSNLAKVIEIGDRGTLNNLLSNTDYYFLGVGTCRSEEGILGNLSLNVEENSIFPNYEIGVIYSENSNVKNNSEAQRYIELLSDVAFNKARV